MRERSRLHRLYRVVLLVAALLVTSATTSLAGHGGCASGASAFGCGSHDGTGNGNGNGGGTGGGAGGGGNPAIFTVELSGSSGDQHRCWRITTGGGRTWGEATDVLEQVGENVDANGETIGWPSCPATPPVPDVWQSMVCPPPPPTPLAMAPDGSPLAGQPGYLEIQGPQTVTIACLGESITATARYVVRWGDGQETATSSRGGPWPDGDLSHTYTDDGPVTIEVEAYWSGVWRGTTLPELPVPTRAELPLDIRQVQSVRDR